MAATDRLSALSDDILYHILSFLPTKFSVATSILSKRWRFLWPYVTILDFDSDYHPRPSCTSFSSTIQRVMFLHKAARNITTFCLHDKVDRCIYDLETWIITLIQHNDLNLHVFLFECYQTWPRHLFTWETLVELTLHGHCKIPNTCIVYMPALKKLRLGLTYFDSNESLPHLLSGCPVLEDLIVDRSVPFDRDMFGCYVTSPALDRLMLGFTLRNGSNNACRLNRGDYMVKLDTPALRYLHLHDSVSKTISGGALTYLIEADVSLDLAIEGTVGYSQSVLEFVGSLHNVKCLKLSTGVMKIPDFSFSTWMVNFDNLTKLELDADCRFISMFLENADNPQVFKICNADKYPNCWTEPKQVPTCLLLHLRTIRIDPMKCTENEFDMVTYFLRNGKVLKKMEIDSGLSLDDRISSFQQGSELCQLVFY